jgi:DNA invertase Pin-like site-specific DNA recombinase
LILRLGAASPRRPPDSALSESASFTRASAAASAVVPSQWEITEKGATFRSLTEGITTTGPMGKAMLTIMAAFAQLERDTIVERTRAGLDAARAKGKVGGRPSKIDAKKLDQIKKLVASKQHTRAEIADMVKISPATLYRVIATLEG